MIQVPTSGARSVRESSDARSGRFARFTWLVGVAGRFRGYASRWGSAQMMMLSGIACMNVGMR